VKMRHLGMRTALKGKPQADRLQIGR
jgi:hypothetical protein